MAGPRHASRSKVRDEEMDSDMDIPIMDMLLNKYGYIVDTYIYICKYSG